MKTSKKIILIGGGGHARVIKTILDLEKDVECVGYTDVKACDIDLPYLGTDQALEKYLKHGIRLILGIGSIDLPRHRQSIYEKFKKWGYQFYSVIHPQAIVSSGVQLSEGVQIMAAAVINTGTVIKENVIINTSSTIEHDCRVGDHSHIAPGVTLSGNVKIGVGCHVGTGATLIQGVTIGDHCLIGAGSVVISNIDSHSKAVGIPARVIETTLRHEII